MEVPSNLEKLNKNAKYSFLRLLVTVEKNFVLAVDVNADRYRNAIDKYLREAKRK